jgi:spermidine/putrescine transport system permease protein
MANNPAGPPRRTRLGEWLRQPGVLVALPTTLFLLVGFAGPLVIVVVYSFMPPRTFSMFQAPTLANFVSVVTDSYYISFFWSFALATVTVGLLLLVCYPIAYGMAKLFGKWANLVTVLIALPLLISENIRLFGWVLILLKNGILDGSLQVVFGLSIPSLLYTVPAIVLGLVYVYLPFMLFPLVIGLSMVPHSLKEAASDLGASRGSLAESKILGGQAVVMIADDIESAFTFAQNWPKGSVLSVMLIAFSGALVFARSAMSDFRRIGSGPLPLPATPMILPWVAGRGSGPVPRESGTL